MPELKNEIPTDIELFNYFLEHIVSSWFGRFYQDQSLVDQSEKYDDDDIILPLLEIGGKTFLKKVPEAIFEGLMRLNRLPREDPFWYKTNKRPTIYKLSPFCSLIIESNPLDIDANWTLAALAVYWSANNYGLDSWERLYKAGEFDISWPIFAGLFGSLYAAVPIMSLVSFIKRTNTIDKALPIIEQCRINRNSRIRECGEQLWHGLNRLE